MSLAPTIFFFYIAVIVRYKYIYILYPTKTKESIKYQMQLFTGKIQKTKTKEKQETVVKCNTKKSLAIVCVYFLCVVVKRPLPTINVIYVMKNIVMLMLGPFQRGKQRSHVNELQTRKLTFVCMFPLPQPIGMCMCACAHSTLR